MGRAGFYGIVFIAICIATHAASAGGRKSAFDAADGGLFAERFVAPRVASLPGNRGSFAFSPASTFDSRSERLAEIHAQSNAGDRQRATGPLDRKISLFRFNTKFGEIGVHPLLGPAKGLQFSLGF
jgi:hypothetical protein